MHPFAPGDRVVAINLDISVPLYPNGDCSAHPFLFPDGPLRRNVVYRVDAVCDRKGRQGLYLCGMRIFWGGRDIAWDSSRFRKVEEVGHPPVAVKKAKPVRAKSIQKTPSTITA
ncbi:MAG: hypothetical protein ACNA8L_03535 [Luteolibacter sp.]